MDSNHDRKLRASLSEEAYRVTQQGDTEAPFTGEYLHTHTPGVYHCVVCGAELFDAETKFDSGSGWPSFFKGMPNALREKSDDSLAMERTEVVCANCGAHLGHVFDDAPQTPTGNRYCINSCALSLKEGE